MSRGAKVGATARVRVVLDIEVSDVWNATASAEQIFSQAAESATGMVRIHLQILKDGESHRVTIVGEPVVTAVLASLGE